MIQDYTLYAPTRVFFGAARGSAFFKRMASEQRRWLLVTGGSSIDRTGIFSTVEQQLSANKIPFQRFSGVEPNPDVASIAAAVKTGSAAGCSGVIALGGGSVMDAAKAISAGMALGKTEVWPLLTGEERIPAGFTALPLWCIPTTAGTASEVTPYAVISNRAVRDKRTLFHEALFPSNSWLNPEFTVHVPAATTAATSADILSHVFENYILGGNESPLADAYAEGVIRTVVQNLPRVWENPNDLEARACLMMASNWALNGYQDAGRRPAHYLLHAIEHVMSAWNPALAHGRGLATLFPAYFHWLLEHHRCEDRLGRLAHVLFGHQGGSYDARMAVIELHKWLRRFGLGESMQELGFTPDQYPAMADQVFSVFRKTVLDAAGPFTPADVVEIFELTRFQHQKP